MGEIARRMNLVRTMFDPFIQECAGFGTLGTPIMLYRSMIRVCIWAPSSSMIVETIRSQSLVPSIHRTFTKEHRCAAHLMAIMGVRLRPLRTAFVGVLRPACRSRTQSIADLDGGEVRMRWDPDHGVLGAIYGTLL